MVKNLISDVSFLCFARDESVPEFFYKPNRTGSGTENSVPEPIGTDFILIKNYKNNLINFVVHYINIIYL